MLLLHSERFPFLHVLANPVENAVTAFCFQAENDDLRMLVMLEETGGVGPSGFAGLIFDVGDHPAVFLDLGDKGLVFGIKLTVLEARKHEEDFRTSI